MYSILHKRSVFIFRLAEKPELPNIFDLLIDVIETPSSKSIARALDISHPTVEPHRSRVLEKIEVGSVVELRLTVGNVLRMVDARSLRGRMSATANAP